MNRSTKQTISDIKIHKKYFIKMQQYAKAAIFRDLENSFKISSERLIIMDKILEKIKNFNEY